MNILFHHRTRGKGAEGVHIRGVTKGLRQLGHQVSILSLPGAEPETEEDQSAKKQIPPKKSGLVASLTNLTKYTPEFVFELIEILFNIISAFRVRKAVNETNAEMIYERYSLFLFSSVWWAKKRNIPIVLEINDSCLVHRVRKLFFVSLAKKFERWIFKNATGLVFISSEFQQIAQQEFGEIAPSVISPNAADLDAFIIDDEKATKLRQQLNINDKTVIGYVGAFVHWHGIDWFVDIIADKLKQYPDIVLLLIGDGVSFAPIQQRIKQADIENQVILTGRVDHKEVSTYLSAMDFGILPDSNNYGSPMKLFEFMAMGKGMVAPDFTPIAEVVKDNETSWLFAAGDRQACIDKTLAIAENNALQKQVGKNARSYIENERQWKHNAQQLLSLISL
ncbi:glycosyl transferase family 1 [Thalassotalea insulae]|uniref:Glycosyl transferase family 1 n=1 Tax=Thalassotalea insulae TaxID=2056778 RepID=A0ABQ6GQE7_9GAMM|nr:glycosyltransferase family 4 protein [Thalassotalea insulae]GLX78198.1 glycosyl transferase family 1 [Thalassotalea insulae]